MPEKPNTTGMTSMDVVREFYPYYRPEGHQILVAKCQEFEIKLNSFTVNNENNFYIVNSNRKTATLKDKNCPRYVEDIYLHPQGKHYSGAYYYRNILECLEAIREIIQARCEQ
jgi:glutamate synthase domain-containing protein 1